MFGIGRTIAILLTWRLRYAALVSSDPWVKQKVQGGFASHSRIAYKKLNAFSSPLKDRHHYFPRSQL